MRANDVDWVALGDDPRLARSMPYLDLVLAAAAVLLAACTTSAPAAPAGPRLLIVPAAEGEVAALVTRFAAQARAEDRQAVVYVGATWCEPCRYFHAAAERGELDDDLPRLALLEFDLDEDGPRLDAAGYASRMIPLFVLPGPDGRGTERRIEGSIHGPGSPAQIVPRLRGILGAAGGGAAR